MPSFRDADRRPIVLVGYGIWLLGQLDSYLPPSSVVLVEDPDLVLKRNAQEATDRFRCVSRLVVAPYHGGMNEELLSHVVREVGSVHGVLAGFEYAVLAAAQIADHLGLPGSSVRAARMFTDKLQLREAASVGGLACPRWREVFSPADIEAFAVSPRIVLKPANRHASLGVQIIHASDDLEMAWSRTMNALDPGLLPDRQPVAWRYMVEEFVEGAEVSSEALVKDSQVIFHNVTTKRLAQSVPVEIGHTVPASDATEVILESMELLIAATGFCTGVLHAEWKMTSEGPVLIECAGRFPGDHIVELIDLAYETSLTGALVELLTGGTPQLPAFPKQSASVEFLVAEPGIVMSVDGVDGACMAPGVQEAEVWVEKGNEVRPLNSSWDRAGHVIAMGMDPQESCQRASDASAMITVRTRPAFS